MNEKYKLNKEWLDLMLENKNNTNLTFNLSDNDTRILLTYIEVLQQENRNIESKIGKVLFEVANLSTFFDINAEFTLTKSLEKFINRFRYIENSTFTQD